MRIFAKKKLLRFLIIFFFWIFLNLIVFNKQVFAYSNKDDCNPSECGKQGCGIVSPPGASCSYQCKYWDDPSLNLDYGPGCYWKCTIHCPPGYETSCLPGHSCTQITVTCEACTNSDTNCYKDNGPLPTSTPIPQQPPPPAGPTTPPAPTSTPRPTPTATPRPTSTPTLIPTATLTPTPNKQFNPVSVPTTAPRQSGTVGSVSNMTWRCLKAERTSNSNYGETKLTGEGFPTDRNIYIVGCVSKDNSFCCTTGTDADSMLRIGGNCVEENKYVFLSTGGNPIILNSSDLETLAESKTKDMTTHVFYGVYIGSYELFPGAGNTITYSSFSMSQDYKKCVAIHWDPYGRVFDSQNLEPIPGVNVFITDKNRKNINLPGITNPATTNLAGFFNFYVEPGEYYLEPESVEGYVFSASPNLNSNYNQIYSNLYKPNEPIYEVAGTVQHRDIALDPGINQSLKNSPREISFNILPGYDTTTTRIIGEVSHPLTRVELYQNKTKIGEAVADKFGYYEISINTNKIKQEVPIIPKLTKVGIYNQQINPSIMNNKNIFIRLLNYLAKFLNPRSTKADPPRSITGSSIMPTLHYLEGFIYDTNKHIVANAKVDVILKMSDQSYYQTTTDDLGKVVILPNDLPIFDYYLKVIPLNSLPFTITTEEFINNNKDYLEANKINLINATKNNLSVL